MISKDHPSVGPREDEGLLNAVEEMTSHVTVAGSWRTNLSHSILSPNSEI